MSAAVQNFETLDVSSICRLCLANGNDLLLINDLTKVYDDCDIKSFIGVFLEIVILGGDDDCSKVCKSCADQLLQTYRFKRKCLRSNGIFLGLFQSERLINYKEEGRNKLNNKVPLNYVFKNALNKDSEYKLVKDKFRSGDFSKVDDIDSSKLVEIKASDCHKGLDIVKITDSFEQPHKGRHLLNKEDSDCFITNEVQDNINKENDVNVGTNHEFESHSEIHNLKEFSCAICDMNFDDSSKLNDHKICHSVHKNYKCSYCDKSFRQKRPLQFHEKVHTGERPYVCDLCGKSYIQPNNLTIHKRTHTGEKPYACKECGKTFTNGASLSLHMPIHTGVKNFVCTICGKRMARNGELTIHMRTHTGEKPYGCTLCPKRFIKKSSLQSHMYSHTGEKKHVCPVCGHRVSQTSKLTVHMRTHSNNKPFSCTICNSQFASRTYLRQHSKIHSGEHPKSFQCRLCPRSFTKNKFLKEHSKTHCEEKNIQ